MPEQMPQNCPPPNTTFRGTVVSEPVDHGYEQRGQGQQGPEFYKFDLSIADANPPSSKSVIMKAHHIDGGVFSGTSVDVCGTVDQDGWVHAVWIRNTQTGAITRPRPSWLQWLPWSVLILLIAVLVIPILFGVNRSPLPDILITVAVLVIAVVVIRRR